LAGSEAIALISGANASQGAEVFVFSDQNGRRTVYANYFKLFGHDGNAGVVGFSPGATDVVPTQSLSAVLNTTLANNGGPTQTHALFSASPAIDAIHDRPCPPSATDQSGVSRPQDGNEDGGLRATLTLLSGDPTNRCHRSLRSYLRIARLLIDLITFHRLHVHQQ